MKYLPKKEEPLSQVGSNKNLVVRDNDTSAKSRIVMLTFEANVAGKSTSSEENGTETETEIEIATETETETETEIETVRG